MLIESGHRTICFSSILGSGSSETFRFPKTVMQFNVVSAGDCEVSWHNNSGTYELFANEALTVPCVTNEVIVTMAVGVAGKVRILGVL